MKENLKCSNKSNNESNSKTENISSLNKELLECSKPEGVILSRIISMIYRLESSDLDR